MTEEDNTAPTEDHAAAVADMVGDNSTAPDWLITDKYMTGERSIEEATQEQAKAYPELQSKFGAFTGAPENYDISLTDAVKEAGGELDMEDGLLVQAMEFAKNSNMSNDSFNELVNIFQMSQIADNNALTEQRESEMKSLGPNAEARINNINAWANKNMSAADVAGLQEVATTASGVQAIEQLISKTRNAPVAVDNAQPSAVMSTEEIQTAQFAKNEHGQLKMAVDPEYRRKVEAMYQTKYGTEDFKTLVGG